MGGLLNFNNNTDDVKTPKLNPLDVLAIEATKLKQPTLNLNEQDMVSKSVGNINTLKIKKDK